MKRLVGVALYIVIVIGVLSANIATAGIIARGKNPKHPHIVAEWHKDSTGSKSIKISNGRWSWHIVPLFIDEEGDAYTVLGFAWSPSGRFLLISVRPWDHDKKKLFSNDRRGVLVWDLSTKNLSVLGLPDFGMGIATDNVSPKWTGSNTLEYTYIETDSASGEAIKQKRKFEPGNMLAEDIEPYAILEYVGNAIIYATKKQQLKIIDEALTVLPASIQNSFKKYMLAHRQFFKYTYYGTAICAEEYSDSDAQPITCREGSYFLYFNQGGIAKNAEIGEEAYEDKEDSLYVYLDSDEGVLQVKVFP